MGDLVQAAETFISKNLGAVIKSADFLQLGVDDVKATLKLESDEDSIDEEKYRSAVAWTLFDFDERQNNFSDLFHLIQLENLTKDFLIKVVQKEKLVCNFTDCMQLLVKSLVSRISEAPACKAKPGQSDEILMIGGLNCPQSVVKFNTKTNQWSNMPDTNIARRYPSAVNYDQQILLMGGWPRLGPYYNSVEMLDLNDENPKWDSNLPSMGEKRYIYASALLNGLVYCAGGRNDTGRLSSCESYNPEERKWSSIRNMNKKRCAHTLVSARGLLYAFGGVNGTNTAECYDPRRGKWECIPPMKTCRFGLTAVVLNNEIYAIGGFDGSNRLSSVEKYNLDTKAWIDVPSMNEERCGGSACLVDGFIWVFGGLGAETVEFYDPAANKWQVSTNMDREREFPCVLSI
ncbi:kelch-like protein 12 [Clavelina lepadiformis]|uniref:kelch-like protein 12 n=1 Tax=Clavelina lepadiformis TaxID=159417 RepID=UPI0040423289